MLLALFETPRSRSSGASTAASGGAGSRSSRAARLPRPRGADEGTRRLPGAAARRSRLPRLGAPAARPRRARCRSGRSPLSLGPGLAWLAAAARARRRRASPADAVGENLLGRFFAGTSHARPFYYYLYQLPLDFLPWTLLARRSGSRRGASSRRSGSGAPPPSGAPIADPSRSARRRAPRRAPARGVQRAWRFLLAWVGATLRLLLALERQARALPAAGLPGARAAARRRACRELAGRTSLPRALGAGLAARTALLGARRRGARSARACSGRPSRARASCSRPSIARACSPSAAATARGRWPVRRGAGSSRGAHGSAALRRLGDPRRLRRARSCSRLFQLLYPALDAGRSPRPIADAAAARDARRASRSAWSATRRWSAGLVYYGGRRVVPLRSQQSIRALPRRRAVARSS